MTRIVGKHAPGNRWSRYLRFRLRTLFVASALISALFAVVLNERHRQAREGDLESRVRALRGWVTWRSRNNAWLLDRFGSRHGQTINAIGCEFVPPDHELLDAIATLGDCRELHLADSAEAHAGILDAVAQLPSLEVLSLVGNRVDAFDFGRASELAHLKVFALTDSILTDEAADQIAGMPGLETLILTSTRVSDRGVQRLSKLSNLRALALGGTEISDEGASHLRRLNRLITLNLAGAKISDAGIQSLQTCRELQWLDLSDTEISDAALEALVSLTNLRGLCLDRTGVTDAGLFELVRLEQLTVLSLDGAKITASGLSLLSRLRSLSSLSIRGCDISKGDLAHLKSALPGVFVDERFE